MARYDHIPGSIGTRRLLGLAVAAAFAISACSSSGGSSAPSAAASTAASTAASAAASTAAGPIGVSLITKTSTNPFFIAMAAGAKEGAAKLGMNLTVAAGKEDGDTATQITAIENAISKGDKGILITPGGPDVNPAIKKARDAGLTPPTPSTSPSRRTTSRPAS